MCHGYVDFISLIAQFLLFQAAVVIFDFEPVVDFTLNLTSCCLSTAQVYDVRAENTTMIHISTLPKRIYRVPKLFKNPIIETNVLICLTGILILIENLTVRSIVVFCLITV